MTKIEFMKNLINKMKDDAMDCKISEIGNYIKVLTKDGSTFIVQLVDLTNIDE